MSYPSYVKSDLYHQKVYRALLGMNSRCYSISYEGQENYSDKGIIVCDRWKGYGEIAYTNLLKDLGLPPSLSHTVERKISTGNYTPENCEWATYSEQLFNRITPVRKNTEAIYCTKYPTKWRISYRKGTKIQHIAYYDLEEQAKFFAQQVAKNRNLMLIIK